MSKFFVLRQNNSGGSFTGPATSLVIEANDADEANNRASKHITLCGDSGRYADYDDCGCCPCCGHRWVRVDTYNEVNSDEELKDLIHFRCTHYALIKADDSITVIDDMAKLEAMKQYVRDNLTTVSHKRTEQ